MQKIYQLDILSYNGPKTFTNMGEGKMSRHQEDLQHRPFKRKEWVPILPDMQVGLHEGQSKI